MKRYIKSAVRGILEEDYTTQSRLATQSVYPRELTELANSSDESVRYDVAANPSTSAEVLVKLSQDKDPDVQYKVALNPNTPVDCLREMFEQSQFSVDGALAHNPNTPTDILIELYRSYDLRQDDYYFIRRTLEKRGVIKEKSK